MSSSRDNYPLNFILQVQGDAEVASKFSKVTSSIQQLNPAASKAQSYRRLCQTDTRAKTE
jgi:hypothetical protein